MLSLTRKTGYALIALTYLAGRRSGLASAREIAEAYKLPTALVMNILKTLQHAGMLMSMRGTKGGYRLTADLNQITLLRLIEVLEGPVKLADCMAAGRDGGSADPELCKIAPGCPIKGAIRELHERIVKILDNLPLSDIIATGGRDHTSATAVGR